MFCGFGAVVLLVLLINSNIITRQQEKVEDHRIEFVKQEVTTTRARQQTDELLEKIRIIEDEARLLSRRESDLQADIENISQTTNQ